VIVRPLRVVVAFAITVAALALAMGAASAAGFTGGLAPTVIGGRLDVNGTGGVGGRDDATDFFDQTDIIDGAIDCNAWGAIDNAGSAGDGVIDAADDCTFVGVDGSLDGVTIDVQDGLVVSFDGVPVGNGVQMPALYNVNPFDQSVQDADFGWWVIDGRVDVNLSGAIDDGDCARGVIGQTDDVGLGDPSDGADVLAASPLCGNPLPVPSTSDGLVDLDSDGSITSADTCTDACFLGQNVANGFVGGLPNAPTISGLSPTSGPVGTTVTISGSGLAVATEVRFTGALATVVSNSDTQLVVTVPSGATTGPITIVTPNGQTSSATPFIVTTTPPGGTHQRAVTLALHRHLAASGAVAVADETSACAVGVDVRVQRKIGKRWRTIQAAQTRRNMTYVAILPDLPGKYRAIVPNATLTNGDRCTSAVSPIVRS
jgi:hypothetical protein